MRGGVSAISLYIGQRRGSSPRAWGCFVIELGLQLEIEVFPTCVGVFHDALSRRLLLEGLPHVRGGVSGYLMLPIEADESSPRAWGCFLPLMIKSTATLVFPTCVGVFPEVINLKWRDVGLPHVRGGVSYIS